MLKTHIHIVNNDQVEIMTYFTVAVQPRKVVFQVFKDVLRHWLPQESLNCSWLAISTKLHSRAHPVLHQPRHHEKNATFLQYTMVLKSDEPSLTENGFSTYEMFNLEMVKLKLIDTKLRDI